DPRAGHAEPAPAQRYAIDEVGGGVAAGVDDGPAPAGEEEKQDRRGGEAEVALAALGEAGVAPPAVPAFREVQRVLDGVGGLVEDVAECRRRLGGDGDRRSVTI